MALKIQLRRDIAANWTANNPLLLNGEIGIETDTLKFKIGNGTQRWNVLSSYALKPGEPNGVATLDSSGKVPLSQLPDQISLDAEAALALQNALSSISTTNISEGTNLYFTNAKARSAVEGLYDQVGSAAQALSSANAHTGAKFQDAISAAASDATLKANGAVILAGQNADQKINTAIVSLNTSVIPESSNRYFTDERVTNIVNPLIISTRNYVDESLANFAPPAAIASTSYLPEGSNLYFTNARAVTATNAARTASLGAALGAVDDLRTELRTDIDNKIPYSDRNSPGGVVGLDSNSKIQDSIIPSTIARTSDITSAISNIVNLAPDSLNTLGELATAFQSDQTGLSSLVTVVGTKLDSSIAATTYAPINSPTFTGTPVIPGYATSINLTAALTEAKAYTDTAKNSIDNSLGGYQPESERNQNNGYAGLDSSGKILESAIPSAITTSIAAATTKANANINGTYTNGSSSSNINKITYGTDLTPPSSGNSAGDIYIQY
jgi:hypothetical protein